MVCVLFRESLAEENEFKICSKYFPTVRFRTDIPKDSLVIPRYSALPYYQELEYDINKLGGSLINSYQQHKWIADFQWYDDLKDYTPETWNDDTFYKSDHNGPFVVKGRTNSKKFQWDKLMFASNKKQASQVAADLMGDDLIGPQGVIYREYVPLKTFETGLNGLPFANEWRFFFYKYNLISYGYYWSIAENTDYVIDPECIRFAMKIADIVSKKVNFFVLDIAEKVNGDWVLIEINDGSMSGLSENDPDILYSRLSSHMRMNYGYRFCT